MAKLTKDNECLFCKFYESDANDYYHEWCNHPDISEEKYLDEEIEYVLICPLTNKSPDE